MAESIESFVTKLKTEGIEQGKQEAEQIRAEARKEAEHLVTEARAQAEKIIADANSEAKGIISRGHTELELASRDAVLKLEEALQQALKSVLLGPIEKDLNDESFLKDMIKSIWDKFLSLNTLSYAPVKINVPPDIHKKLADWAVNELRSCYEEASGDFGLKDNLRQAGFEFTVMHGATIEVTRDSVMEMLMGLVGPRLRDIILNATEDN